MNIRSINSTNSAQASVNFASQNAIGNIGGAFVGGSGFISVANTTDGFFCAGGDSTLSLVNQGDAAQIQAGSGIAGGIKKTDENGNTTYVKNDIISVGSSCHINGSADDDVVFSLGQNCDINLGSGADKAFISGAGTTVNGGSGNDLISGTPAGLSYATLKSLDIISMLAKIYQNSVNIVYKNLTSNS